MDENNSLFFCPYTPGSNKLGKFRPLKLKNPINIQEIKNILEQNINKPLTENKKENLSSKRIIRNFPSSTKCMSKKIQSQRSHFYPKFQISNRQDSFMFKPLKTRSPSPYLRSIQSRLQEKRLQSSNAFKKIQVPELNLEFDYKAELQMFEDDSGSCSSRSEKFQTRYH
jgi:hypothetical protein